MEEVDGVMTATLSPEELVEMERIVAVATREGAKARLNQEATARLWESHQALLKENSRLLQNKDASWFELNDLLGASLEMKQEVEALNRALISRNSELEKEVERLSRPCRRLCCAGETEAQPKSDICPFCGAPKNSGQCQKNHP